MSDYRFYASEVCEDGERISADKILREIHDAQCMCGVWDDCDTEGISHTLLEAAQALLATGKWSVNFEDGWIRVDPV
jgi:hypothetical protein